MCPQAHLEGHPHYLPIQVPGGQMLLGKVCRWGLTHLHVGLATLLHPFPYQVLEVPSGFPLILTQAPQIFL